MKYRPEIDGLRTLAVVPVILFHAGFESFSGGFVGVDVFFVISGYLITTIIINDIEKKRFSLVNFYEKRAKRILPALCFVIFLCIPFAWMWMSPVQLKDFLQSLIAVGLFASNILFWKESGYFATAAEEKPLLHTWSLAVEEQYYIFFPIFLILMWRFGREKIFWTTFILSIISLAFSEWSWRNHPSANFYLAPTRAWELLAGSMVAFTLKKHLVRASNVLSIIGILAILYAIFAYNKDTPFPSFYTLLPVLGVVLLILFATKNTFVAKLLSTKLLVGMGLISYSAYLWHQPLFAFVKIRTFGEPTGLLMGLLSVVSICLAYISWKFIETPFRKKDYIPRNLIFGSSVFGILFFIGFGLFGFITDGYKNRFTEKQRMDWISNKMLGTYSTSQITGTDAFEYIGVTRNSAWNSVTVTKLKNSNPIGKILIIGDSHAGHFRNGFSDYVAQELNYEIHVMTFIGCPPLIGFYKLYGIPQSVETAKQKSCRNQTKLWQAYLENTVNKYKVIILSSRWNWLIGDAKYGDKKIRLDAVLPNDITAAGVAQLSQKNRIDMLSSALENTATFYNNIGVPLVILAQPPLQLYDLRKTVLEKDFDSARPTRVMAYARQKAFDSVLNFRKKRDFQNFYYLNMFDIYCPLNNVYCSNRVGSHSFYSDEDHLSEFGSERTAMTFVKSYLFLFE